MPDSASAYSGLAFMGGPMSVNDDLPWIARELDLIRDAVAKGIPVIGHCLGGQLMSKALGGAVSKNPVKEIGWGSVQVADNETARSWFGDIKNFDAFHWHGETFALPEGAVHILSSAHCINQGYAIGPHLALQCHVEMTPELIKSWCDVGVEEIEAGKNSPAVQSADEMQKQMQHKLPRLHVVAGRLYDKWLQGISRT
jgi:GMP synthase-like glutamine amidotransferase